MTLELPGWREGVAAVREEENQEKMASRKAKGLGSRLLSVAAARSRESRVPTIGLRGLEVIGNLGESGFRGWWGPSQGV